MFGFAKLWALKPRKKIFVNRQLQGRVALRMVGYWAVYHIALWHCLFLLRYVGYRMQMMNGGQAMPFQELYGTFVQEHHPILLSAVLILPILIVDVIRQTHRIAGPIVRFEKTLRESMSGATPRPIKLRPGDLMFELADTINEFLAYHHQKLAELSKNSPLVSSDESVERDVLSESQADLVHSTISSPDAAVAIR